MIDERVKLLEETLRMMIGYLGHMDQDADHGWMARKMRDALAGRNLFADLDQRLAAFHEDKDEDK